MARPKKSESIVHDVVVEKYEATSEDKPKESLAKIIVPEKTAKQENKQKLNKYIEEETKLVEGRFRNYETPGGSSRIQILKYKGVPMFDKTMMDGETYKIPLYVARHLNGVDKTAEHIGGNIGTCSYPVHGFKWDPSQPQPPSAYGSGPNGEGGIPVPIIGVAKRVRRFGFESLEFSTTDKV